MNLRSDRVDELAATAASSIRSSFISLQAEFNTITRRARTRFEQRDWVGDRRDAVERLDIYRNVMQRVEAELRDRLGADISSSELWKRIKAVYAGAIARARNSELAETFFNSATRRIFDTVGVNADVEFVSLETSISALAADPGVCDRYEPEGRTPEAVERILEACGFEAAFDDLRRDARRATELIESQLAGASIKSIETVRRPFFRDKAAYVVGRIRTGEGVTPLVLPLRNDERGIHLDAVLTDRTDVSILFSFTRSYFHVEAGCPRDLVLFLKSILPEKPVAELYISLGFNKHGKTEQYRSLQRNLARNRERFEVAEGDRGMVMLVFALPHFDLVFKVIRDRFDYPKQTTRRQVMDNYRLVFELDRVGRLVDAQEFEHLSFDRELFEPELLRQLLEEAGETVSVENERVHVKHLYTERKITPLNLYLQRVDARLAEEAVLDYGLAIKELAAANIFPGDFLLKNFGVTRHGRVVFYDYDELCLLTDCRFRRMPEPRNDEEVLESEPWFSPGPDDIFPEEFVRFLGLRSPYRELFIREHGDLFGVDLWREMQEHHLAGEIPDFHPYPLRRRLPRDQSSSR